MNIDISDTNKVQFVLVVGMHRSGTSLMSLLLNKMGVDFGSNLLGATHANPYGHFEDNFIIQENENILRMAGGSWDAPPSPDKIKDMWSLSMKSVGDYLNGQASNKKIFGIKEPRMSLLMPQYLSLLDGCKVIYIKRSCDEVASSIGVRNRIDYSYSKMLCEYYNREISNNITSDNDVFTVSYNEVKEKGEEVLNDISDFLGIEVDDRDVELISESIKDKKTLNRESKKYRNNRFFLKTIMNPIKAYKVGFNVLRRYVLRKRWNDGA
jgi:hypothetical protein